MKTILFLLLMVGASAVQAQLFTVDSSAGPILVTLTSADEALVAAEDFDALAALEPTLTGAAYDPTFLLLESQALGAGSALITALQGQPLTKGAHDFDSPTDSVGGVTSSCDPLFIMLATTLGCRQRVQECCARYVNCLYGTTQICPPVLRPSFMCRNRGALCEAVDTTCIANAGCAFL